MADYKNIKGFNIQYLDSDPPNPIEGQMWFNSTTQTLKGAEAGGAPLGTWASGGSMPAARQEGSGFGTQTAALVAGGLAPSRTNSTIEYNGSAWTTGGDLANPTSESGGFGIQTAGIIVGGYTGTPPVTGTNAAYEYNGSSWSPITSLNTARTSHPGACGTTTAGLIFGGYEPTANTAKTEDWNGSSWTELNDLNTARRIVQGVGTQTAALAATGFITAASGAAETWNGTSWTNITSVSTPRFGAASGINGVNTSALLFGGLNPPTYYAQTEFWNGSSWTELNDLATARNFGMSGGNSSAALYSGGYTGTAMTSDVEEWSVPDYVVKTFTTS